MVQQRCGARAARRREWAGGRLPRTMSNAGLFHDTAPQLPAAGKSMVVAADTAAACFAEQQRPPTPEEIKRFRKSFTGQPGVRVHHWGLEQDPAPRPPEFAFGVTGEKGQGVGDLLGGHLEPTSMQAFQRMRAEAVYESSKREPLGKPIDRHYQWPDKIKQDPGFKFGIMGPSNPDLGEDVEKAIDAIFPKDAPSLASTSEHAELYKRSHNAYEPGEQRERKYTWDKVKPGKAHGVGIDPGTFAFGASAEIDYRNGVAKAINPSLEYDSKCAPTEFMPKSVADFKKVRQDDLGTVRNLGLGQHPLPADHAYGLSSKRFNDWGARECIMGNYTPDEQAPDPDLGRSLRRGCAPEEVLVSERTFGVPGVRSDIRPPKMPSVADAKNYGNEPGAKAVIFPQPFATIGVYEEDFLQPRPKGDLLDICVASGLADSEAHFEELYTAAQRASGASEDDALAVESIRQALYAATLKS